MLKSGRKLRAQNEIDESRRVFHVFCRFHDENSRVDIRGSKRSYPDGPSCYWMDSPSKVVPSSVRAAMISQERRRRVEQDRVTRAVQQWKSNVRRVIETYEVGRNSSEDLCRSSKAKD